MKFDPILIWTRRPLVNDFLLAFGAAVAFSAFIYLAHWHVSVALLDTFLALVAFYALLTLGRRALFITGFFIGLLWFYWIGYSFEYYGMPWAVPLVSLAFGVIYSLFFGVLAFTARPWLRAFILVLLSFIEPFDFNWMQPELLLVNSYLGVEKWQFALILLLLTLVASIKHPRRYLFLLLLPLSINYATPALSPSPLKIKLVATDIPQDLKWQPFMRTSIVDANFAAIDQAIEENYELVVLPESAYPLYLNRHPDTLAMLLERSKRIAIVTGALLYEDGQNYNVTYFFDQGDLQIAKKMILVPFGEYIPLPAFARTWVNETFFGGASDYQHADRPSDFTIRGVTFRNAVCYEATCHELFDGRPAYMIAISNNAWFMPSIEPTLQRVLMQFYAQKNGTTIFHAANAAGTGIVQ